MINGYLIDEAGYIASFYVSYSKGAEPHNFIESAEMPPLTGKSLRANAEKTAIEYVAIEVTEVGGPELSDEQKITLLKWKLSQTDYQTLKFLEGQISAEDYAETKAQRQAWRAEINELSK